MRKNVILGIALLGVMITMGGCSNKALEEAQATAQSYNSALAGYEELIGDYNDTAKKIEAENQALDDSINIAQESINKGEIPYDETTLDLLKSTMAEATEAKVSMPELLPEYAELIVDENLKNKELQAMTEQAVVDIETMKNTVVPELPEVPDYTETIEKLEGALSAYENSIQSLKQVTAPSDEFVMERLQLVDTILAMEAVTEDYDPNGKLNKQGGYIGCVYFSDKNVDRSELYIVDGKDGVIDIGTDGGGAIEIFANVEDAKTRDEYLGAFDGTMLSTGSHYIVGTCLIRTSDYLTGTQQKELTEKITESFLMVD